MLWPLHLHVPRPKLDMRFQRHALALAATLVVPSTFAQQEVERQPQSGSQFERVEVRGQRANENEMRRRAPVAKQLYGREELDKYGDTQLSDVLKRLPGVNVQGGQLRMRGLGGAFTQILVNGEQAPPGFSLDQVNPAQVERIEVTKSPTADQSAQAIAGTVNIILKDAPRVVQKDLRLGLAFSDDKPVFNGNFTYGDRKGGLGFVMPVSFFSWRSKNESSGERLGRDASLQPQLLRTEGFDVPWGHGLNVSPRINFKIKDDETLTFQGFFIRNNFRNRGETDTTVVRGSTPTSVDDRFSNRGNFSAWRLSAQYNNRFEEDHRIELRASSGAGGADFKTRFLGRNAQGQQTIERLTTGKNEQDGTQFSGKYWVLIGDAHTFTAGGEVERRTRDERRRTTEIRNNIESDLLPGIEGQPFDATSTRSAIYAQDEWEISPQWSAYLGVRNERIRVQSEGQGSTFRSTSSVTTPLVHLNYKFDPKGRDLIRASLTRSYKAPNIEQLIARPTINTNFPVSGPNTETAPDRVGNPLLKPELATGLDIAWEKYLKAGGLVSVGVFHRRITGLVRNTLVQERVSWATGPRWVAKPVNLSRASTSGLELEVKGRANELFPSLFEPTLALNLRASLSVYSSKVKDIPGPDNRLDGQQPWSSNLGLDYRMKSLPVSMGASLAFTPSFEVQQTSLQRLDTGRARTLDAFAMWNLSRTETLRFSINNFQPVDARSNTLLSTGDYSWTERLPKVWYAINWEQKF
jgi:outer membrane receptor for ferrienterochelin and colicins